MVDYINKFNYDITIIVHYFQFFEHINIMMLFNLESYNFLSNFFTQKEINRWIRQIL